MHFMRTQNAIRKSDQTKIHLILTPHLLCESIMFGYHCAMCSNREKSLVINSGSISIIILVERGKTRRPNVLRVYCQRTDFHIAYCIYGCFFCFVIILFPFLLFFLFTKQTSNHGGAVLQLNRPSVSIKNKIIYNKYKFSSAFRIVMFLWQLLCIRLCVCIFFCA